MIVIDIKSSMPLVEEAMDELVRMLSFYTGKQKVVKILHGYGSTGVGGAIKKATHRLLSQWRSSKRIMAYIPGEGFDLNSGYQEAIHTYKDLIRNDSDYGHSNDGITYVILK